MTQDIKIRGLAQTIIFIYVCSLYIGPEMLSADIGFMHLSIGRFLQLLIAGMCLCKITKYSLKNPLKIPLFSNSYSICFFACWFAYAILSIIWAKDYYAWLRFCYFLFSGIVTIWAVTFYVDSLDDIKSLLQISMTMTILHALIGYYEVNTGNYFFLQDVDRIAIYIRDSLPVSSMHNVNNYATVMLIGFYSSIAVYLFTRRKVVRLLIFLILIFLLFMMGITRSRGIMLGLCFSIMLLGVLYAPVRKKLILAGATIIILSILLIITLPDIRESLMNYCNVIFKLDFNNRNSSDSIRLNLILNGLTYLKDTLFMGTGIGNIEYYMQNYPYYDTKNIFDIHNWWMEILVSSGIFIFAGYCIFYWRLCQQMWQLSKYSHHNDIRKIGAVMLGFLLAFTIASISSSSLMGNDIVWLYFATVIAFERIAFTHKYY